MQGLPTGRPNVMFELPTLYGTSSHLVPLTANDLQAVSGRCANRSVIPCDEDVFLLCCHLQNMHGLQVPQNFKSGLETYIFLRNTIKSMV